MCASFPLTLPISSLLFHGIAVAYSAPEKAYKMIIENWGFFGNVSGSGNELTTIKIIVVYLEKNKKSATVC